MKAKSKCKANNFRLSCSMEIISTSAVGIDGTFTLANLKTDFPTERYTGQGFTM